METFHDVSNGVSNGVSKRSSNEVLLVMNAIEVVRTGRFR